MAARSSLALLLLPLACLGAESCPWLNAATAGGLLGGGAVTTSVTQESTNRDDAVCVFRAGASELRLEVMTIDPPRSAFTAHAAECAENQAPLKGIGNEAVVCGGAGSAQAVARVRNRIFVVRVTTSGDAAALRENARAAAEHVAGNLF